MKPYRMIYMDMLLGARGIGEKIPPSRHHAREPASRHPSLPCTAARFCTCALARYAGIAYNAFARKKLRNEKMGHDVVLSYGKGFDRRDGGISAYNLLGRKGSWRVASSICRD
jgi:hypothetical protein